MRQQMWFAMSATVTGDASHNSRWENVNGWRRTLPLPSHSLRTERLFSGIGVLSSIRILEKQNWLQMSQVLFLVRTLIISWFCFSRILIGAAPYATLRSLHLAGLRRRPR